jgi:hypothetical protein
MTSSAHLISRMPLLHNMSAPSKSTISFEAPKHRVLGKGVIVALPYDFPELTPKHILRLLRQDTRTKQPEAVLTKLIEDRAKELPLPPVVAITDQARDGDTECEDLLTILTILAKSSSRVYLRNKTPNLQSIASGRRLVLILPKEVSL